MLGSLIQLLLTCLGLTILIETTLAIILGVRKWDILIVVLAQIVTNPIVVLTSNLAMYLIAGHYDLVSFYTTMAIMEVLAIIAEGFLYKYAFKDYQAIKPFLLSFILNGISVSLGFIILK